MDITHANLAGLNTGFNTAFNERLTGVATTYARVAMTVQSTTSQTTYPKLADLPAMREWVGERFVNQVDVDGFVIRNRKFENTVSVPIDAIQDDQYGVYAPLFADLGQTAAELPDDLVWDQLASGFATTHYDGQFFFDTDHPVENQDGVISSVSNFGGGSGTAWYLIDTTRAIKPLIFQDRQPAQLTAKTSLTDDNVFYADAFVWGAKRRCAAGFGAWQLAFASKQTLNAANYAAARAAMLGMTGHRGRKLNLRPSLLVVPPSLEGAARAILLAEMDAAGATNLWRNTAELHVETRLS